MAQKKLEIRSASIVLVGSFNPAIFQPAWFVAQNLLRDGSVDLGGETLVVHPQVTRFETESFIIQVTPDKFIATTKPTEHWLPLADLVMGTFYILEHTPVTAMGLNSQSHYSIADEETWHRIGDALAPKDAWKEILDGRPGMATVQIQGKPLGSAAHKITIAVQPSVKVKPFGVYFDTNEHYQGPKESTLVNLLETLRSRWDNAQQYADLVANHIIDWTVDRATVAR